MALKAIDFFCGIGGVTRGFLNKGIDVIAGIDIDDNCRETYEANNIRVNGESSKFFTADITNFDVNLLRDLYAKDDKLIVIGCAPCQPFTKITKNLLGREKERGLLQCFSDTIQKLNPEYIFLENVQGLNSPDNKVVLDSFIQSLAPKYILTPKVIDASHFGVPQGRKRMILFAKKNGKIDYPTRTHGAGKGLKPIVTLENAIRKLPPISAGERHATLSTHVCNRLELISIQRLKHQKKPGDGMEKWPNNLQLPSRKDKQYSGHKDVYARLWWDRPCSTLTTKFCSISNGRFVHPEQNRGLSILEGLLIQTFPKNFKMLSPLIAKQARQIGNAVPVKLAEAFANKILEEEGIVSSQRKTDSQTLLF
jgi:DNA (cytosine-5)-methyltransferase 1